MFENSEKTPSWGSSFACFSYTVILLRTISSPVAAVWASACLAVDTPMKNFPMNFSWSHVVSSFFVCAANITNSSCAVRSFAFAHGVTNSKTLPVAIAEMTTAVM